MKKFYFLLLFSAMAFGLQAQQPKYVFYFIGDGMGINQVNGTEMYMADKGEGRIGVKPLLFANFPIVGYATTFSASNPITDSAAAGTALATGHKTYNGAIGVDTSKSSVESVAEKAKKAGKRVGIATSVSIDHATPAAFYAHQPNRDMNYEIALDLIKADFDFYAGGGFLKPTTNAKKQEVRSIFPQMEEAGYTLAYGLDQYKAKAAQAEKMVMMQAEGKNPDCLPYAIDREDDDLSLKQITESALEFLTKGKNKGFFLMVEGGKIDWACHGNDPATAFNEVMDMDEAIAVAYEFYKKHPKETLIVVTADHETGGMGLGNSNYEMKLKMLDEQEHSQDVLSHQITNLRRMRKVMNWNEMKEFLGEKMGFWKEVPVSWEQEKMLRDAYEESFVKNHVVFEKSLYAKTEPLAVVAKQVMSQIAQVGWTSGTHTAGYVPVYAVGAKSELFCGKMDNTEIPARIIKAAKY